MKLTPFITLLMGQPITGASDETEWRNQAGMDPNDSKGEWSRSVLEREVLERW